MGNVLDLYDQAYFDFERAAGATCALQCVWVYDRGIDIDGLRSFHHRDSRFPHHSLSRQIFTDEQFEAYRSLGHAAGRRAAAVLNLPTSQLRS